MRHTWGVLVDFGRLPSDDPLSPPTPYWVTDENICARCGLTRHKARGKACEPVDNPETMAPNDGSAAPGTGKS